MKLSQQINLANEIWLAMHEMAELIPTYMVLQNLNPYLMINSEDYTKRDLSKHLAEYINSYSDCITIVRILKDKLTK